MRPASSLHDAAGGSKGAFRLSPAITRRALLAGMAALIAAPRAFAAGAPRVATLDWALLETLLFIGADVVAATELVQYRQVAVWPPAGPQIADLGLRGSPNLERLPGLKPDLIFNSNFYAWADPLLARIAPVESLSIHVPGQSPWTLAEEAARRMGERLALPQAAQKIEALAEGIAALGRAPQLRDIGPVLAVSLGDARHIRVFGSDSMFGETLRHLGIANAWPAQTRYSAMAPVGLEALAGMPDAFVLFVGPHDPSAFGAMTAGTFWQALPQARNGRARAIGPVNPYGGLPSAQRFAGLLAEGLGIHAD